MDNDEFVQGDLRKRAGNDCEDGRGAYNDVQNDTLTSSALVAEIVKIPALHERAGSTMLRMSFDMSATIINFPVPQWQRNASRRSG